MNTGAVLAGLLLALAAAASAATGVPPAHDIWLRIEPQARTLEGRDAIAFDPPRAATLMLSARFRIDSLQVDGRRVEAPASGAASVQRIALPKARRVELRWSGRLGALERGLDHRDTLSRGAPASGAEGTFLPAASAWYPAVEGSLERYAVTLDLPAGQKGLVPGRLVEETEIHDRYRARFEFAHPAQGITLLAGPYTIDERRARTAAGTQVRLRTYFHPEIAELASGYLDSIVGFLDMYERWIGAYPYSEFSVVSSPTPTGFGMPTLTYLGAEVLRLPFIRTVSLGHEILHNWWGNGVYPDPARGDWSEGLTSFMADYAYRERESAQAALEMRLSWLRDYAAMPPAEDTALLRFSARRHGASQIVGYHKAAMLFFMLRDSIGEAAFDQGLRSFWREHRFRVASWDDLRGAFERASGRKLESFFEQWLARTGAPQLRIADARAQRADARWRLSVTLAQGPSAYALSVPLQIRARSEIAERRVELRRQRETVVLDLASEPLSVALDPELRLFRRLAQAEAPPILREVMLAGAPMLVSLSDDDGVQQAAQALAARLLERSARAPEAAERAGAVLVIGLHPDIDEWIAAAGLPPRPARGAAARGSAQVWTLRGEDGRAMAFVSARSALSLAALARPLPHYGQQSWLVFEGARNLERGVWPSQPQVWRLDGADGVR